MRRLLAIGVGAFLLVCPAAGAQELVGFVVTLPNAPGARDLKETDVVGSVTGSLTVSFRGSEAAGCGSHGVCGTEGTLEWRPGDQADLGVERYVVHGQHRMTGTLGFDNATTVEATRRRRSDGTTAVCSDAQQPEVLGPSAGGPGPHSLSVRLDDAGESPDIFKTRCAGPLAADIVPLLPIRPLSRSVLRGRRPVVDLSTTRPFSAGGFAGTVRSNVVIRFARPLHDPFPSPPSRPHRFRVVDARYRIENVSGAVTESFRGLDALGSCEPLGSCGANGTVAENVPSGAGTLILEAVTRRRISPQRALALFGAARGSPGRLGATGIGEWRSHRATTTATVSFEEGSTACRDTVPARTGSLSAEVNARGLQLAYASGIFAPDPFVTRCQGPTLRDLTHGDTVAVGRVPARALRKSVIRVVLTHRSGSRAAAGYEGSIASRLVVTLRRISVRTRTLTVPF